MLNAMAELILLTYLNLIKNRSFYIKPNSKQCKQIWNFQTGMDCVPQMLIHFPLYPKYSREQIFNYHVTKTIFLPSICLRWKCWIRYFQNSPSIPTRKPTDNGIRAHGKWRRIKIEVSCTNWHLVHSTSLINFVLLPRTMHQRSLY